MCVCVCVLCVCAYVCVVCVHDAVYPVEFRVDEDLKVKVADFGMARDIHSAEYYKLTHRQKLPLKWMAPESIFDGKFSSKSDVVSSTGNMYCVLYVL